MGKVAFEYVVFCSVVFESVVVVFASVTAVDGEKVVVFASVSLEEVVVFVMFVSVREVGVGETAAAVVGEIAAAFVG